MSSTPILAKIAVSAANTAESTAQTCQEANVSEFMNGPSIGANRHCEEPTGPAFGWPDGKLRDDLSAVAGGEGGSNPLLLCGPMDCFAEPVIGRAFARPVGPQ